jgi:hypothetical protein
MGLKRVTCMLCPAQEGKLTDQSYCAAIMSVVMEHDWAMSLFDGKVLVCCPDCYHTAFDKSKGVVGLLRPEFECKAVELSKLEE